MADATNKNNVESAQERVEESGPFSGHDDPIAELASEGDHEEPSGETKPDDTKPEGEVSPAVQALLDKMEEKLAEHAETVQYLKGQNAILAQNRPVERKEEKVEEPLFVLPSKEALQKALDNPETAADALVNIFTEFGNNIVKKLSKVEESSRGEHQRRDAQTRWQSAINEDLRSAEEELGEIVHDKAFQKDVDLVMYDRIAKRTGKAKETLTWGDLQPGDASYAASTVYARWLKTGKISGNDNTNGNKNGNNGERGGNRPTLREALNQTSNSDRMPNGGPRGGGGAKSMRDLYPNERDFRIADSARRKMGVSESDWVKSRLAIQAEEEQGG